MRTDRYAVLILLVLIMTENITAQLIAFPGAEGSGKYTTGGRGGKVYEVTNLNDSGAGSLREAINASGARTVVFRVSGTIELKSELRISRGDITVAGQTAPGDGICISNYPFSINANNVIVRYLRIRLGDLYRQETDAMSGFGAKKNIIIDHCSVSWSLDEAASFYDNENFTMQWCLISESLYHSYHSKGDHGYGGIWGGHGATFHHNLFAHHSSRNPRFNGGRTSGGLQVEFVDFVNNVIYNWGFNSAYGGEEGNQNVRLNYYKYGPATSAGVKYRIVEPSDTASNWFVQGNFVYGYPDISADNWKGGVQGGNADYQLKKKALNPFPFTEVKTQSPVDAYDIVLKHAGAVAPKRDTLDERIINEVKTGTAHYGKTYGGGGKGIIDSQKDVGGWPVLKSLPAPIDSDHDGMPDNWEISHNLNPNDQNDRNILDPDGYTMLEVYLNGIVQNISSISITENNLPVDFNLFPNYPNPFNPETYISFSIPAAGNVEINIYDINGRLTRRLLNEDCIKGIYRLKWNGLSENGSSAVSGVYFCAVRYNSFSKVQKLILRK